MKGLGLVSLDICITLASRYSIVSMRFLFYVFLLPYRQYYGHTECAEGDNITHTKLPNIQATPMTHCCPIFHVYNFLLENAYLLIETIEGGIDNEHTFHSDTREFMGVCYIYESAYTYKIKQSLIRAMSMLVRV